MNIKSSIKQHVTFILIMSSIVLIFMTGLFVLYNTNILPYKENDILKIVMVGWMIAFVLFIGQSLNLALIVLKMIYSGSNNKPTTESTKNLCQNAIVLSAYTVLFLVFTYLTFL